MAKDQPVVKKTAVAVLEVFPNPHPARSYEIQIRAPEFTSVCPVTGQPDFGTMVIRYAPGPLCLELKSLKLYLQQYRNQGIFYEDITNRILNDLVRACRPRWMELQSTWTPRGGISSTITVVHTGKRAAGRRPS